MVNKTKGTARRFKSRRGRWKRNTPSTTLLTKHLRGWLPKELLSLFAESRLLIISVSCSPRQSRTTAAARNKFVCEMANKIVFVGVNKTSSLFELKKEFCAKVEGLKYN